VPRKRFYFVFLTFTAGVPGIAGSPLNSKRAAHEFTPPAERRRLGRASDDKANATGIG
jgi:hypothetical protein